MNNKNIKDTFEFFAPTEGQKRIIYESIVNRQKIEGKRRGLHFKAKLAYSLTACFIIVVAAVILLNNYKSLLEPDTQYYQANNSSDNSSLQGVTDKLFNGFVLTAYAANSEGAYLSANFMEEAEKQVLKPDVKVLLAKYTPAMSSVPGLPFTVDIKKDDENNYYVEAIKASVDCGGFDRWDRETGILTAEGQSITIDTGETIYWSPMYSDDAANENKITITIKAVANNIVVGKQSIYITQDKQGYYYATMGELEL